jgi:transposase
MFLPGRGSRDSCHGQSRKNENERKARRLRETSSVRPRKIGGYKPRAIAGEHRAWLLVRIKEKDLTFRGLMAELAARGRSGLSPTTRS